MSIIDASSTTSRSTASRPLLVALEARSLRLQLEQAVECRRLLAGRLGHPLGGAAGGSGEQHALALLAEDLDEGADEGRLAGARSAGEHQHLAEHGAADRLVLGRSEGDAEALLEPAAGTLHVDRHRRQREGDQPAKPHGGAALGEEEGDEVDGVVGAGVVRVCPDGRAGSGAVEEASAQPPRRRPGAR